MSHELETSCPYCGRANELHAGVGTPDFPESGDVSVCFGCHRSAVFAAGPLGLALRVPTAAEQVGIDADPRVREAVAAMRAVRTGGAS